MRLTMTMINSQIIEQILDLMRRDESHDAPQDSVKWAKNVFRSRMAESKATIGQRILAVLQMDIAPNKPAFGERSGGTGQARQMLFDAGNHSIDIRINDRDEGIEIRGQVLGEGFESATIEISSLADNYKADLNEMSEFKLAGVAKGSYTLTLISGETKIAVEGLEFR